MASPEGSDDGRGHDDGDIFVGDPEERASALRVQIKITVLMLAEEMGYGPIEIADELVATAHVLRHGHTTVSSERQRTDTKE